MKSSRSRSHGERGFTLIELLVVVAIVGMLSAIAVPNYSKSIQKARRVALVADAKSLHDALVKYHVDQSSYPATAALSKTTLDPLASLGYFPQVQGFVNKLEGGKVLLYWSTGDQYVAWLRHALDPSILVMTADNSFWPGFGYEGVYVLQGGFWVRVNEVD